MALDSKPHFEQNDCAHHHSLTFAMGYIVIWRFSESLGDVEGERQVVLKVRDPEDSFNSSKLGVMER